MSEHLCGVGAQGRAAPQAHSGQEEGRDPTGSTIQVAVLWEGFCFHLYSQATSKYGKVERKLLDFEALEVFRGGSVQIGLTRCGIAPFPALPLSL